MPDEPLVPLVPAEVPRIGGALAESISAAIQKALDTMEPGQRGAVDVRLTMAGAEAIIAVRVKDLELGGVVDHQWQGDTQAGGFIRWRW